VVAVAAAAGVRLEAVDGRRVTVSGGADRTVRGWDARSGNHRRIEVHAQAHSIVTTEELIVVATSLAWRLPVHDDRRCSSPPPSTEMRP
jgi:hypothetical protein